MFNNVASYVTKLNNYVVITNNYSQFTENSQDNS